MSNLSNEDYRILTDPETRALVEKHLAEDPVQLAFRLNGNREQARLVCQQVKYLGRARLKLPSYYAARCIIPPLSYEQCSSEATAAMKEYGGKLCIDLTGGLGVDSYYFSKAFQKVITVERDPVLAGIERFNFSRLGASRIRVENSSAEHFLAAYSGPQADLIYVDPARRQEGERVFLLEDCSPDIVSLMPLLLEKGKKVLVKLSPLFDVQEALRIYPEQLSKVEIVSVGGEVKELLVEWTFRPDSTQIIVRTGPGKAFAFIPEHIANTSENDLENPNDYPLLLIPDASFYKGRLSQALFDRYFPEYDVKMPVKTGFAFAGKAPAGFPGRIYRILETRSYQPKPLRKKLKTAGTGRINILRRNFPYSSAEIKQALGVQEGGSTWLAFTEMNGKPVVFIVEPVSAN